MWRPRSKSKVRARASPTTSNFSCSSFKDIQTLCTDDSDDSQQPQNLPISSRRASIFHRVRLANSLIRAWSTRDSTGLPGEPTNVSPPPPPPPPPEPPILLPGAEKRIVVYLTSLRVIRPTFEACQAVRSILWGFRVPIDERDLSMDSKFMEELQGILGIKSKNKLFLPRVFIGGRYIGGANEIRQLHEVGELKRFIEGLPVLDPGGGVCDVCGGYRFILCSECSGSHKCYSEKGGFRTCTACNENGLSRCPSCLSDKI
ncbi:hypothetical protein NMG60_11014460 [Bertholletia excelsa]